MMMIDISLHTVVGIKVSYIASTILSGVQRFAVIIADIMAYIYNGYIYNRIIDRRF